MASGNQGFFEESDNAKSAMCGLREVIDLRGEDQYDEEDLHPGCVLVTFNGLTSSVAVVDEDAERSIDADEAAEAATDYMRMRGLISERQMPSYVFRLEGEDLPGYMDESTYERIEEAVNEYLDIHANQSAAESSSTLGDQTFDDLEQAGYDPESVVAIADFGDEVAVNGDLLVSPHWVKELGLVHPLHPVTWKEAAVEGAVSRMGASGELGDWLDEHGYELTDEGGDVRFSDEIEIEVDHVIEHTARELGCTEEQVELVLRQEDLGEPGGRIYRTSDPGTVSVWAMPVSVSCLIEFVRTDSDDYSSVWYAIVDGGRTEEDALEAFVSALEGGEEGIWSAEAVESGDTPERTEPRPTRYGTEFLKQSWYMTWYADETGEEEDEEPETVSELLSIRAVKCFGSREELDGYLVDKSIGESKIAWEGEYS